MGDNGVELLETAYLKIYNYMEPDEPTVSNSATKQILSGRGIQAGSSEQNSILKVQFNPEKLSFSAGSKGIVPDIGTGETKSSVLQSKQGEVLSADIGKKEGRLTVSIRLMFDRTIYIKDSVMEEVEGFLAMVQNPYVREVAFYWGSQCYRGSITSLSAEYLMFNADGLPIQAAVDFSIDLM